MLSIIMKREINLDFVGSVEMSELYSSLFCVKVLLQPPKCNNEAEMIAESG